MYAVKNDKAFFMQLTKEVFELIFPKGIFEWFDLTAGVNKDNVAHITFVEKDIPPPSEDHKSKKILARKFHDITITDFPLRGRRTVLLFRRRYWKIEGEQKYLKRDIQLAFPGTQLAKEFALFLKAGGGRTASNSFIYRSSKSSS